MIFCHSRCAFLPPSLGENEVFAQPDLAGDLIELAKCQREQNGREALWVSPNGDINSNS
jgi:hypothetical protein